MPMLRTSAVTSGRQGSPAPRKALGNVGQPEEQATSSISKVIVLVTGLFPPNSFTFLDILGSYSEVTYVTTADSQAEDVKRYVEGANIVSVDLLLGQYTSKSYDALFIPGQEGECQGERSVCGTVIQKLYDEEGDIIATGSGRLQLLGTNIVNGKTLSSRSLDLEAAADIHTKRSDRNTSAEDHEEIQWVDSPITQFLNVWTAAGTPDALRSLAYYYKAVRKCGMVYGTVFPFRPKTTSAEGEGQSDIATPAPSPRTESAEELAGKIASQPTSHAEFVPSEIICFAISLGLQGFVSACNSLILNLLHVLPGAFKDEGPVRTEDRHILELIWEISGQRPAVPWDAPPDAEMETWEKKLRDACSYPSEDELLDILEAVKVRMDLDTEFTHMRPYTMAGVVSMALEAGWKAEAKEWLTYLVQISHPYIWNQEIRPWRKVAEFAMGGVLAEILGRTPEDGDRDAAIVNRALLAFPTTSAAIEEQQRMTDHKFAAAPLSALIPILDVLKWEQDETLLKPPASPSAIAEAEARLGVQLPDEYKQFLLLSNGLGPTTTDMPGLRSVEELRWEDPYELGLDLLPIDLGSGIDSTHDDKLPKPKRILVVSDEVSEETLWLVEPGDVDEAMRVLKELGKPADALGPRGWRPVHFVAWAASVEWPATFRKYVEDLAKEAQKAGGVMDQEFLPSRL